MKKERKNSKKEKGSKNEIIKKKSTTKLRRSKVESQIVKIEEYDENNLATLISKPKRGSLSDESLKYVTFYCKIII